MKGPEYVTISAMTWLLICKAMMSSPNLSTAQDSTAAVSVEDIGTKVTLIGRLGEPLGTMLEVKGTWRYPDLNVKDYSLRFNVTHVNGKALEKPVEFNVSQINAVSKRGENAIPKGEDLKALEGAAWTLRLFETGHYNAIPLDYWKERGEFPPAFPYWYKTFTSELVGVVQGR